MRIIFETDDREDVNSTQVDLDSVVGNCLSADWMYAIATSVLALSIVIVPVSNWIDSFVFIQQARQFVNPQYHQSAGTDLANRIYQAMRRKGYEVSTNHGEVNIIYIRGANQFGKKNNNAINEWSDRRLVLMFRNGNPVIVGNWAATVKPGLPAIKNPLGKSGAAFIEPGQYRAWQVGSHHGIFGRVEEGLVQVAPVSFRRDVSRDGNVNGEPVQSGKIGLNQHSGSNQRYVDASSYACLAAQSVLGHRSFMSVVKSDPRYHQNPNYLFATTVLDVNDL